MTHIDEENVKKIIKESVEKTEIKLSSKQIITRFHDEKQTVRVKPRRFSPLQLKIGLIFLSAFLVVGTFTYLTHAFSLFGRGTSQHSTSITTSDEQYSDKVADGKEGEFIFMVTSALLYVPGGSSGVEAAPQNKYYSMQALLDKTNLEATLDETLPLVEQFYEAKKGYQFKNHRGGAYQGKHGTYPNEYIVNDTIRIVVNVEVEDDSNEIETEIIGELIKGEHSYRITGEKQRNKQKGQMNFALKIEYDDDAYLQVFSKNNHNEQTFTYHLTVDDEEILFVEISTTRRGPMNNRFVGVDVVHAGITYRFEIEYRSEKFFIEYGDYVITASKTESNQYEYFYEITA